jgi:hypothetical protein
MPSDKEIEAAAEALLNFSDNEPLPASSTEMARAALHAAEKVREPVIFETSDYFGRRLKCTVGGPEYIVVEKAPP